MKDLLIDYSNNHEDISQPLIFWPSVMILLLSVVGMMWSLETPFAFSDVSPILNWGTLFLMVMTVYCFLISFVLAIGLIPFVISTIMLFLWLENLDYSIMYISIYSLIFSLYGIYRGRRIQNNLSSVIEDLQMVIIAPLLLLLKIYTKLGIQVFDPTNKCRQLGNINEKVRK